MMNKVLSAALSSGMIALAPLPLATADADPGLQPAAPAKAEINALPPLGKGRDMVRSYQQNTPVPSRGAQDKPGDVYRDRVNTPYSREIVPPSYRYGSPGYMPDGRGGRGYDFGYPGYRDTGGGGYPHHRSFGGRRVR